LHLGSVPEYSHLLRQRNARRPGESGAPEERLRFANGNVANVICIKWGTAYTEKDVNILHSMVSRNINNNFLKFYCFTDNPEGLNEGIVPKPLPVMNMKKEDCRYAYQKEAGLCDDNLGGLKGQRVLFFDLDVVITGSLDCFFDYARNDDFVIINDWNTRGNHVGQASCYSWRVGTLGYVKKHFEKYHRQVIARFGTASQEYLSSMILERGDLKFWPQEWCRSFKVHAMPVWFLRPFVEPSLPEGTRVLVFHGRPKIEDAIKGIWSPHGVPFFKRLYKTIRPAPWIRNYWL